MKKTIETIWKEGFLNNEALVAPKINNLYNQKSKHIVDKFKRMYTINIIAIIVFAMILVPTTIAVDMPYMGIPMAVLFVALSLIAIKLRKRLLMIDYSQNSYQYLSSFDQWVRNMIALNTKLSRYLYPLVFISLGTGFWFGGIGGDIPGQDFVNELLLNYPDMLTVFGLPLYGVLGAILLLAVLAFFGGHIGKWDINLVYGGILKKLDSMMSEMEELRA